MTLNKLRFQIDLWTAARTLPLRVYGRSLSEILNLSRARRPNAYRGLSSDYIVKAIFRIVRRPFVMRDRRCLREGLLAFQFLEAAGFAPKLYFGIDRSAPNRPDVRAHCWVVCNDEVVLNSPDADMVPILVWPNAERALELPNGLAQANFD
jgi:Transglutaminase-like superfamily